MSLIAVQAGPQGPLVDLAVGVSVPRQQALRKANLPVPQVVIARALLDTGASCTSIDKRILNSLQLQPIGSIQLHTPSTGTKAHSCSQYDVLLAVPHASGSHLVLPTVPVCEIDLSAQAIDALIGRDVLSRCVFIYNGVSGQCTLAF